VFIKMSDHICINICIYTIFLNKNWERVSSELQSICLLVSCVCLIRKLNSPGVEEKYNIGVDIINQLTSSEIHRGTGAYPLTPDVGSLTWGPERKPPVLPHTDQRVKDGVGCNVAAGLGDVPLTGAPTLPSCSRVLASP
jgi:hypothetical protein